MNVLAISGKLLSRPLFISNVLKVVVMPFSLFPATSLRIFIFLSLLMIGLLSRTKKSRLLLHTACSHCISANTCSSCPFSIDRSINDFAYLDAKRGFGIVRSKFEIRFRNSNFVLRFLIQFYFINQPLDMSFLGVLIFQFLSQ